MACGSPQSDANPSKALEIKKSDLPFSTTEPEVFQADVSVSGGGQDDRYFVARNGAKRRFDTYIDGKLAVTELIGDTRCVIDHRRRVYSADPLSDQGPAAVNPASLAYFQNTEHYQFAQVGRSNGQTIYRAKLQDGDPGDVLITIDDASGLMVRQEVSVTEPDEKFTFELTNVKLDAPDELFQIPSGYQEVSAAEFKATQSKKNP
jgi:hypothetical protein